MKTAIKMCLAVAGCAIGIGIVILIISTFVIRGNGGVAGGYDYSMYDVYDSKDPNITSLEIDINYGEVKIEEGDNFSVSVENMMENSFSSEVSAGVWSIRNELDDGQTMNLFGWRIPIHIFGNGLYSTYRTKVTITLPKDFIAESMRISIDSGSLWAGKLETKRGYLQVGAGEMEIDQFIARENSSYQVGAGELNIREILAEDAEIDCGVGEVDIAGVMTGKIFVNCGVGKTLLNLEGKEEDYSYDVDCGIGEVSVNESRYGGIGASNYSRSKNGQHYLSLECGIGSIEVKIR